MKLENKKKLQVIFKSNLNQISNETFKRAKEKVKEQQSALDNIKLLSESRKDTLELFNVNFSIVQEAKYKTKYRECLKILAPKQMLRRLSIALTQAKARNTSKNLLNKIRQNIFSLYRATEITKKVYNNVMNSIKV